MSGESTTGNTATQARRPSAAKRDQPRNQMRNRASKSASKSASKANEQPQATQPAPGSPAAVAADRARPIQTRRQMEQSAVASWARSHPEEALAQAAHDHYGRDHLLVKILEARGVYGAKPPALSKTQIDDLVADGAQEFHHGFSSPNGHEIFQRILAGQFEPGQGTFGSGLYTGIGLAGRSEAYAYSGTGKTGQPVKGAGLIRGAIPKDARIYDEAKIEKDFHADRNAFLKAHGSQATSMRVAMASAPNDLAPADRAVFATLFGDFGRYAAAKGYDSVGSKGWGLVVNPAAVAFQRSFIPDPKSQTTMYRDSLTALMGKALTVAKGSGPGGRLTAKENTALRARVEAEFAQREQARIAKFAANRDARAARAEARALARKNAQAANATGTSPDTLAAVAAAAPA